ncbi:MAG: protein kinase domain-containing protein [Mariniblastus sp.]
MKSERLESQRDILGYTLQDRIGTGGFGEVWSAIAPGGLSKALKIIYGFHDEKRAQSELKALDRVKALRHPFLLSLERIEVFEGQLVVVSELADKSLAESFNEHKAKGQLGIPRALVLRYLRGVAEALDYMREAHALQHLDIKPENLLLVGDHVKVADFGLIKDIDAGSHSLMSGMTPAYAAPELFDGCPGMHSDQYSLAIVYQEMLTGTRPFPGNTPAQLAAQHLHGKPNLRQLPKGDQSIVAKALSKDPTLRYPNCRDFINELVNKKRTVKKSIRRSDIHLDVDSNTMTLPGSNNSQQVTPTLSGLGLPYKGTALKSLGPPDCKPQQVKLRPTLVVTIGATANRIAHKLKKQIGCRHGDLAELPSTQILAIDTDRQALNELCAIGVNGALGVSEVIDVPLRKPEVYRDRSHSLLSWLGRRWIYNVPRSLQTEGLRPLGRLAFADHFDMICNRIQESLREIMEVENLAKSADKLNIDPGELSPRVFLVTSISGGVGSGMALDLAYTLKLLMNENNITSSTVSGILLHSTCKQKRDPTLSTANAISFLTEMRHFVERGFTGDPTIGLPDFENEPPFDFTYFNDLGHDLRSSEFDHNLDQVAEYLYLSSTSRCAEFLDKCRDIESEFDHFSLRTFGMSSTGPGNLKTGQDAVSRVASGLVYRWLGGDRGRQFNANEFVDRQMKMAGLEEDQLVHRISVTANDVFEGRIGTIVSDAKEIVLANSDDLRLTIQEFLDGVFGATDTRNLESADLEVCHEMQELTQQMAAKDAEQLRDEILKMVSSQELNIFKAQQSVACLLARIEGVQVKLEQSIRNHRSELAAKLNELRPFSDERARSSKEFEVRLDRAVNGYCDARCTEFYRRFTTSYYRTVARELESTREMVNKFKTKLEKIQVDFESFEEVEEVETTDEFNMNQIFSENINRDLDQQILKTELQVYQSLIRDWGDYVSVFNDASLMRSQLPQQIRSSAQQVLTNAYKKVSLDDVVQKENIGPEQLVKWTKDRIREARPKVDDCGGTCRLMVGMPALSGESMLPKILESKFKLKNCAVNGTQGNFVLCFEGEDVPLANVAFRLLESQPDAPELVRRINTRNDIDWSTLDELL